MLGSSSEYQEVVIGDRILDSVRFVGFAELQQSAIKTRHVAYWVYSLMMDGPEGV